MRLNKRALLCLCVLFPIVSCTTHVYRPMKGEFSAGYKEVAIGDSKYRLITVAHSGSLAKSFWHRRANELCGPDYTHNIYKASRPTMHYGAYGANPGLFQLEGTLTCNEPIDNYIL